MPLRKSITEADLLAFLTEHRLRFPPLRVAEHQIESTQTTDNTVLRMDAILTLSWGDRTYRFAVEARRLWTPKILSEAVYTVKRHVSLGDEGMLLARQAGQQLYPLVLVPYLSEEWLLKLEAEGVSGIDLCGNGVVVVPGELLVLRTGFPNLYRWEGTIKNVYRKNSSIAARLFLLVPEFRSVKEALAEIRRRGGQLTLPTVSKVCKSLEDDLVIERSRAESRTRRRSSSRESDRILRQLRLLQPDKLLDLLAGNYMQPAVGRAFRGKCGLRPEELRMRLAAWEEQSRARIILTGESSVDAYAVMAREAIQSFYCSDLDGAVKCLGNDIRETDRFANVSLLETRDDLVYFDRRPSLVASPIQAYLELVNGDKRQRETADQVRQVILKPLAQAGGKG